MRVIVAHTYYRMRGGEDDMFEREVSLLRDHGHHVTEFVRRNAETSAAGAVSGTIWNASVARDLARTITATEAQVVHVHNWAPAMSPVVFRAAKRSGAAVVHTLHNFRQICPTGTLFRDGSRCEECVSRRVAWPAVAHGCYRDSRSASAVMTASLAIHRALGTFTEAVDAFIVPSQAAATVLTSVLPDDRVHVKPNFLATDPGAGSGNGDHAVFLGRLVAEKGIRTLLDAWSRLDRPLQLLVFGTGPLEPLVMDAARRDPRIVSMGFASAAQFDQAIKDARFLVAPSTAPEVFGLAVLEAFGRGTPVIASSAGALAELVDDGVTGVHVRPSDPIDLARKIDALDTDAPTRAKMRRQARAEFLSRYEPSANHRALLAVYDGAIHTRHRARVGV